MFACYQIPFFRYKSLCPSTWPNYPGSTKEGVSVLCKHLQYNEDDYRLGRFVEELDDDVCIRKIPSVIASYC